MALSTGAINLAGSLVGGIPMCHGAGGMAAYTAFGARSGGAPIVFGATLAILALCFSDSIGFLLQAVPPAVLGTILFLAGGRLVAGNLPPGRDWRTLLPVALTAAVAIAHVGLGFLVGMTVSWAVRTLRQAQRQTAQALAGQLEHGRRHRRGDRRHARLAHAFAAARRWRGSPSPPAARGPCAAPDSRRSSTAARARP